MDIEAIVEAVRSKDYVVQSAARQAGSAALPALVGLLQDPDEEVRELSIHCIVGIGDPSAGEWLAWAAMDQDPQVAMAAAKALHGLATPAAVPRLLDGLDRATDPAVRREIALVLGRVVGPDDQAALAARWSSEPVAETREGLTVALAKLGHDAARQAFAQELLASRGPERRRWLEHVEYVGQSWVLRPLAQVLDDPEPLLFVGIDVRPELPSSLRACDIALRLIAEIGRATFSFEVSRGKNYAAAQLDEARRFVGTLP